MQVLIQVLVLGATGRIGGILRKCWPQAQGHVLWQARAISGWPEGPEEPDRSEAPGWVILDPLTQPEALARAASGASAILCLAGVTSGRAQTVVPGAEGGDLSDNTALAEAAIRASAASGAASCPQVFLASSAAVYGDQPGLLQETAPLCPVSAYGRAKAAMEARAAALGASLGVPVCALRIGNIAGIDAILGGWTPGFRLDRFADGRTPRRSYIGVMTLAQVLGDLMRANDLPAALNIACPGTIEMGALLQAAGLAWVPQPAPETAIAEVCLSTRALARITPLPKTDADTLMAEWRAMKELA